MNIVGGNKMSQNPTDWKHYDMTKIVLSELGEETCFEMKTKDISDRCRDRMKLDPSLCTNWNEECGPTLINAHGKILLEFVDNDSPMLVSTDDSHIPGK